jgi:hypothetical protein
LDKRTPIRTISRILSWNNRSYGYVYRISNYQLSPQCKNNKMEKKFTIEDIAKGRDDEKTRIFHLLNYILNKNSHPKPRGMDWDKLLLDLEDLEDYLSDV